MCFKIFVGYIELYLENTYTCDRVTSSVHLCLIIIIIIIIIIKSERHDNVIV